MNNISDYYNEDDGYPLLPHLPLDRCHFTEGEEVSAWNVLIDVLARFNHGRLESDGFIESLIDVSRPDERWFSSKRCSGYSDDEGSYTDSFKAMEGMCRISFDIDWLSCILIP